MVDVVDDIDDAFLAINYRYIMKKRELEWKEKYTHVAVIITAAITARTKAVMAATDTSKQSRRIERFLNDIKITPYGVQLQGLSRFYAP
jgi:hypothetical protein